MVRTLFIALAGVAMMSIAVAPAAAQFGEGNSPNNLFQQYYTQPGASMTQAGMYPAPHYVPSNVGHSNYTYQPLMPHEMLYQHNRNYYNYYNTGGYYGGYNALNKTEVRWQSGANHMGPLPFSGAAFQSLQWKWNKGRYCLGGNCDQGYGSGIGRGSLRHRGGCASGDCSGYSYEGASYDAGRESFSGGCASGSCATNPSENVQR